ncbi:hypothetical protein C8Q76DRAFT_725816 [Earliella scabrosa]|nr:hypothetical protein C8Q76DRAFT_725816 [Earliella scabrosa]
MSTPGERYWLQNIKRLELSVLYAARQMLLVHENDRDCHWRDYTRSILDKFVTHVDPPRCRPEMFISTMSPLAIGNDTLAWTASDKVAVYWIHADVVEQEQASYNVIRNVLAVSDWRLRHWRHEGYTFKNMKAWLRAGRCVLLCLSRTFNNSRISAKQLESISNISRRVLCRLEELLQEQDWARLEPEYLVTMDGIGPSEWAGIVPHWLAGILVEWIVEPLALVYRSGTARAAVPDSLPATLESTWSAVERAWPMPSMDLQQVESYLVPSGLDEIRPTLGMLRLLQGSQSHNLVHRRD